jgi:hypothetical protein
MASTSPTRARILPLAHGTAAVSIMFARTPKIPPIATFAVARCAMLERISIELTNRCTKARGFCYNKSHAAGM